MAGWYTLFVFLTLMHFSLSKPPGVQKQLKRHGSRLKIVEAKLEFGNDRLSDISERLLMIESMLNDTTLHSVKGVENGDSKQELSSDVTNVRSPTCVGSGIRKQLERHESHLKFCEAREERILEAFYQEKILNEGLREEMSELKAVVSRMEKDMIHILEEFQQEKMLNGRHKEDISHLKVIVSDVEKDMAQAADDLQTIRNTSVTAEELYEYCKHGDLTKKMNNVEERAETALKTCKKVDSEVQHIISRLPSNSCQELFDHDITESGVYNVYPRGAPVSVFCDMETDSGGWTVFQRRKDGSEDFYRNWADYEQGFGDLDGEFWLGNKLISEMTADCCYELRIDLEDFKGNTAYAKYANFKVMSKATNYTLMVGKYSGNASDCLDGYHHSGSQFSTKDRDNDKDVSRNCAETYKGAWWYGDCYESNLNGLYLNDKLYSYDKGISWFYWKNRNDPLKLTEMKYRKI